MLIIAFLILLGFRNTVRDKIYGFNGHLIVSKYTMGVSFAEDPVSTNQNFFQNQEDYHFIDHVQGFGHKAGLIKTDEEVDGVVFKGVGPEFSLDHFAGGLKSGSFISFDTGSYSTDVILSQEIADRLRLNIGDPFVMHFVQDPPRSRRLEVKGIYETGMEDFDDRIIIGDIGLIRRLNNWPDTLTGGFEVFVKDPERIDAALEEMNNVASYDLFVQRVTDKYLQIFDWLKLINNNVTILLTLILFVASFNMVSIVLILIMERTQMIGLLKAVGAEDSLVSRIFRYQGISLVLKGMVIGNVVGLLLCFIQYQFRVITLDPKSYYMSYVPIEWDWGVVLLLNLVVLVVVGLVLWFPTRVISRIDPIRAIRFD